jgi:hypothetical protein
VRDSVRDSSRGVMTGRTISTLGSETNRSIRDISARDSSRVTKDDLNNYQAHELFNFKVSQIKSNIGTEHPEILDKWRAKRASNFINTQKHPELPPTGRDLTSRPFKGGGSTECGVSERYVKKGSKGNKKSSNYQNQSPSQMTESLNTLMEELKKTDSEIERQQLKLSLKNKTKGYEK